MPCAFIVDIMTLLGIYFLPWSLLVQVRHMVYDPSADCLSKVDGALRWTVITCPRCGWRTLHGRLSMACHIQATYMGLWCCVYDWFI